MTERETRALAEYQRWLATTPAPSDEYLFAEAKARFEARPEDVLVCLDELDLVQAQSDVTLRSRRLRASVTIARATKPAVSRLLALIDGQRSVGEIAAVAGDERALFERILASALGSVLFVPYAVTELESALSGVELVRFVGTPYELVRNYWSNMLDVRNAAEASLDEPRSGADFVAWLRRLHVLGLMGETLNRFYRPASRITASAVRPGELYTTATRSVKTPERTMLFEGPRVGVNLVGGAHYHGLVCAADPEALAAERELHDESGIAWGRVVYGRAPNDETDAAWFCPPRPATPAHFDGLFGAYSAALAAAQRGEVTAAVLALARFHHHFVRLHPFRCANQSLAMNLVNLVLRRSHGAGIPHLMLDQFALRLSAPAYAAVFAQAVRAHCVQGSASERWAALRARKAAAYALIERLQAAPDLERARELARDDRAGSEAALIPSETP